MGFMFAIVGGGLTGTSMLCQLVRALRKQAQRGGCLGFPGMSVAVVEKQDEFGPGFPHSAKNALPFHLINMCAEDMSIDAERPLDFHEWVAAQADDLAKRFPEEFAAPEGIEGQCTYYPRVVMGRYLTARFQEAVAEARALGVEVQLLPHCETLDLREWNDGITIKGIDLASGRGFVLNADRALLATGHWSRPPAGDRNLLSPWPARALLEHVPDGSRVTVVGTSLTAVDAALTLSSRGTYVRTGAGALEFMAPPRPVVTILCSRNGLLPRVRGRSGSYRNRFLTTDAIAALTRPGSAGVHLDVLFRLLDADLRAAYGRAMDWEEVWPPKAASLDSLQQALDQAREGDGSEGELLWQTVLHQSFGMAREVYLHLPAAERHRFERDFSRVFFTYASPMSKAVAEKLAALMRAGVVRVMRVGDVPPSPATGLGGWNGLPPGDFVVDARGQETSIRSDPSPLVRSLLQSGTVEIEDGGGLWIDPATQGVKRTRPDGSVEVSRRLFAVGAMTRGQIIDTSMAWASALSTARVVAQLESVVMGL